jgi:hypothetical protein
MAVSQEGGVSFPSVFSDHLCQHRVARRVGTPYSAPNRVQDPPFSVVHHGSIKVLKTGIQDIAIAGQGCNRLFSVKTILDQCSSFP